MQCANGYLLNEDGSCKTTCDTNATCTNAFGNDYFCNFPNATNTSSGNGQCALLTVFTPSLETTVAGKSWLHGERRETDPKTNWWSAKSWCEAQGYRLAKRSDFGCSSCATCDDTTRCCDTEVTDALYAAGYTFGRGSWLDDEVTSSKMYTVGFLVRSVCSNDKGTGFHILCVKP